MVTLRNAESPTQFWTNVFRYDFGVFGVLLSIIAWIVLVVWLFDEQMGGLGSRKSVVTKEYFNWHPFLMGTAFLLFMAPAVVSFEMYPMARHTNKNIHGALMLGAVVSAFAGLSIILDCHNNLTNVGSFLTLHGCVGLFTLIVLALNYIGGFVMYVLKWGGSLRGTLKPLHKRMGLLCILLGLATITIGVQEKADKGGLTDRALEMTYAIGVLVYGVIGSTVFTVAKFVDKVDGPAKKDNSVIVPDDKSSLVVNVAEAHADETTNLIQA